MIADKEQVKKDILRLLSDADDGRMDKDDLEFLLDKIENMRIDRALLILWERNEARFLAKNGELCIQKL